MIKAIKGRLNSKMHEIEYLFYLSAESADRLRISAQKEKGEILEFVVQYEALISGEWRSSGKIRYSTWFYTRI